METSLFAGCLAVLLAFAFCCAAVASFVAMLRRRRTSMAAQGEASALVGLVGWRLRNGFPLALPFARRLLGFGRVRDLAEDAVELCVAKGLRTSAEPLVSVAVVGAGVLLCVSSLLLGNPLAGAACVACLVAVAVVIAANARDKRDEAMRDAVPDALDTMAACFSSGFTLLQTFTEVARDVPGPLGNTFARSANILETGGGAEEALDALRKGAHASELAFVAVALDVQHQSGGAMRQVLAAAADTVKGTLALRRSLRVQTAQARLSARIVSLMPLILVAAFSLASPDFLMPFFSGPLGYALLALAVVMQAAGVMLVRRALSVEGIA